ncbi:MAG TPA: cytochrome c [Roseiflexaceae bacterium]|nr:cytochrome c [Roseiflexaceae bacterium]HMP40807.1 cytochrome c [Roseiflexaceae bacterium]
MLRTIGRRAGRMPLSRAVKLGWIAFCLLFTAACHLEMYDQPSYRPLQSNEFFADGAAQRPLVDNTVARGNVRLDEISTGRVGGAEDGAYVTSNPLTVTPDLLSRGEDRFRIYCAVCHGTVGNGRGSAVYPQFNPRPASFYDPVVVDAPDGYLFDVISNGKGIMYPYRSRIQNVEDRWAIIAYMRELQKNPPAEE